MTSGAPGSHLVSCAFYIERYATLRGLPHHHRTPTRKFTLQASHVNEMADEHTGCSTGHEVRTMSDAGGGIIIKQPVKKFIHGTFLLA